MNKKVFQFMYGRKEKERLRRAKISALYTMLHRPLIDKVLADMTMLRPCSGVFVPGPHRSPTHTFALSLL